MTINQEKGQNEGKSKEFNTKDIQKKGTWNLRSLHGKGDDLEAEFEGMGLAVSTITQTK